MIGAFRVFSVKLTFSCGHSPHLSVIFAIQRIIVVLHYRCCCKNYFIDLHIQTTLCIYILECLFTPSTHHTRNKSSLIIPYSHLVKTRIGSNYFDIVFYYVLPESIKKIDTSL
nr:unnamed protein product [Callosobruchus chinensis]